MYQYLVLKNCIELKVYKILILIFFLFSIRHNNQDQFNQAKDLVVNLAQTILTQIHQEQSQEHIPTQSAPQPGFQQSHPGQIAISKSLK